MGKGVLSESNVMNTKQNGVFHKKYKESNVALELF